MPLPPPPTSDLLTVNDVARRLKVGVRTVWRWLAQGRLPQPLRFTALCVRWRIADLNRFIEEHADRREESRPA
jgi:prophage regulatory protein